MPDTFEKPLVRPQIVRGSAFSVPEAQIVKATGKWSLTGTFPKTPSTLSRSLKLSMAAA